ncbi:MAG: hypothetical protein D6722_08255 [Bacteroidetes bacterium]|nr:MAG: hypothetical protein D6722_08255 [Bacteroidota bacterium]
MIEPRYPRWATHWLPLLLWMGLIFLLSAQDKDESRQTSEWVLFFLKWIHVDLEAFKASGGLLVVRKLAHMTEYFILYQLAWRVADGIGHRGWRWWLPWLGCVLYAASDEYHQTFVPGRGASPVDVGIDSLGALLGMVARWLWVRRQAGQALA